MVNGFLRGKRALVTGLLNKHSLSAFITQSLLDQGAQVVVCSRAPLQPSQQRACGFVTPTSAEPAACSRVHFHHCDVQKPEEIHQLMQFCSELFNGKLDILVHSLAFAPPESFRNPESKSATGLLQTTPQAWDTALQISAYSLIALTRAAYPLMSHESLVDKDKSVLALTYAGAQKVVPNYNVMGPAKAALEATSRALAFELGNDKIRVNCISPGPMNTVSARGIPGISRMREYAETHAPLQTRVLGKEVGDLAAFLASDLASGITGQTVFVDGGLSAMAPYSRDLQ